MNNIPADVIFFVILAVVLLLQFNSIIGKEGKDKLRGISKQKQENLNKIVDLAKKQQEMAKNNSKDVSFLEISKAVYNKSLEVTKTVDAGIESFKKADKSFDLENFIKGVISAFGMIVLAYSRGNLVVLKTMLNDDMFEAFKEDISKRNKKEFIDNKIEKINVIKVMKAKLVGTMMYITVKFVSEQTNAIRDENGQVLKGDPEQVNEVTDVWTFARDSKSKNPNWSLVESQS
ncbi:MAG: Tim44/TimA family putative adaptor protein [Alphaproteobacteria bacterium]|jgi:predicted lipid-binding transport protein (Tim44 family)|nr:Tim44/TimA family putative adaptor protein [Alphaproteobacteria bacterium]